MISQSELKRQAIGFAGEAVEFRETRRAVANSKLVEFETQCWRLANLARRGIVRKSNAVDLLHEVAIAHAIVRAHGETYVEAVLDQAFDDADCNALRSEVA
jgi:hypothetical protein